MYTKLDIYALVNVMVTNTILFTVIVMVTITILLVFSEVRVTRTLVLCVCFVDRCFSFCTFSFGHCVVCSSIYGF
jgi:hypothetical protein